MDNFEKTGYSLLLVIAILYVVALVVGMVAAYPFGIIGLILITGIGLLSIKVVKERLRNKEDDYYSDRVDK